MTNAPKPIVAIGRNEFNIQHWREAVTLHQGDFKVDAHVIEQAELLLIWNGQQREQRDVVEWAGVCRGRRRCRRCWRRSTWKTVGEPSNGKDH